MQRCSSTSSLAVKHSRLLQPECCENSVVRPLAVLLLFLTVKLISIRMDGLLGAKENVGMRKTCSSRSF
jgi:hypothetical protein